MAKHSNVKPPEPEKPAKDDEVDKEIEIKVRAPIRESLPRPAIETPLTTLQPTVAPALKEAIDSLKVSTVATSTKVKTDEG